MSFVECAKRSRSMEFPVHLLKFLCIDNLETMWWIFGSWGLYLYTRQQQQQQQQLKLMKRSLTILRGLTILRANFACLEWCVTCDALCGIKGLVKLPWMSWKLSFATLVATSCAAFLPARNNLWRWAPSGWVDVIVDEVVNIMAPVFFFLSRWCKTKAFSCKWMIFK